ncbi:RHS repeat-associated core domain-containing protein, partial [Enterobacter chengduensis]|uniref:RHS repeat-associated core domain-containing protein n=1 Tax=Enterobacter chengduensis TaxID=2494701 RepID=UPI002005354D
GRLPHNPQLQEALSDTTHRVWLYEDEHDFRPLLMLCGRETAPGVYHYVCDHLGTPLELRDVRGRVVWSAMLRSYGQVLHADTAGINQPLRFQGQYHDAESGLYYNRHRYYDPGVGRYLSPDPVGLDGGLNQYAYVPDPLSWIDPLGLSCRNDYLGRTPGKNSRTGREVIARMRDEGKIRGYGSRTTFQDSKGNWHPLSEADMSHKTDAVTWWNNIGRDLGPKSKPVREWMLNSDNYYLDHYSINRSQGAKLGQVYFQPLE